MTDHRLSTRDLAARSDTEDSPEMEQPTGDATGASATSDPGSSVEMAGADTSLTRDPAPDTEKEPDGTDDEPLFPHDQRERFTDRWQEIQISFVDQPRE